MKLKNPQGMKGSFGLPKEVQEAAEAMREKRAAPQPPPEDEPKSREVEEDWPLGEETGFEPQQPEDLPTDDSVEKEDPFSILKDLGIEVSEDDFHNLMFRGYVEKVVPIMVNPMNKEEILTAKLRLLTAEELDLVDELLAEDMDSLKMTHQGLEARRSSWVMSFAVQELLGRPLCRTVAGKNGEIDLKETAKKRRQVLSKTNSAVLNRIINVHARMFMAYSLIQQEANEDFLKKS